MRIATLTCFLLLATLSALAGKNETLEQLKARVDTGSPDEKIKVAIEIADRQVAAADKFFTDGKVEAAHAAVEDVAVYAEKARDVSIASGRRLKDTEIAARKMSRRLDGIKRTVAFEDQPVIDQTIKRLEDARTALLSHMFSKDKKK